MRRIPRPIVSVLLSMMVSLPASGQTNVTSREQFMRLMPDGLPKGLNYNFDRAFLEVDRDHDRHNCPAASRAFFNLHVNKQGAVSKASGRILSLSAHLKGMVLAWAGDLLKQLRFAPLRYGSNPTSVNVAVTVVCQ